MYIYLYHILKFNLEIQPTKQNTGLKFEWDFGLCHKTIPLFCLRLKLKLLSWVEIVNSGNNGDKRKNKCYPIPILVSLSVAFDLVKRRHKALPLRRRQPHSPLHKSSTLYLLSLKLNLCIPILYFFFLCGGLVNRSLPDIV